MSRQGRDVKQPESECYLYWLNKATRHKFYALSIKSVLAVAFLCVKLQAA